MRLLFGNAQSIQVCATWNSHQWYMKMPDSMKTGVSRRLQKISMETSGRGVRTEVSDVEIWTIPEDEHRFIRFYVYMKLSGQSLTPMIKALGDSVGGGIWGMGRDATLPFWSNNGNEYLGCALDSPFTVVQISKYVERGSTDYSQLFEILEATWSRLESHEKTYYDDVRYNRAINWNPVGKLLAHHV